MKCPVCKTALTKERIGDWGITFLCPTCEGRSVGMSLLRRRFEKDAVNDLWRRARAATRRGERICPACALPMAEIGVTRDGRETLVDACSFCFLLWFDRGEMDAMPEKPPASMPREETAAELRAAFRDDFDVQEVDAWSRDGLPAWLGLPDKDGAPERSIVPVVTWALAAFLVALTLGPVVSDLLRGEWWSRWEMSPTLRAMARAWGFIPAEAGRHGGLTWVSCFFLHGSVFHMLVNVYFLMLAGVDCEGLLGAGRFVLLLFVSVLVGCLTHWAFVPDSRNPAIGASGGVSGLLAWYAFALPKVRVGLVFWGFWYDLYRFRMPVRWAFAAWLLLQLYGLLLSPAYFSGVSYGAHLGGAFAGVAWWWAFDRRRTASAA